MANRTTLEVDVTQPASMELLLPSPPIFFNPHFIPLDYHHQPAWKTPSFYSLQHIITVFVGQATCVHQMIGQRAQRATYTMGQVGIYPAHQIQTLSWEQEIECIDLYLAPEVIARYADTSLELDRVELLPQLAIEDSLISSLGITLKRQIEHNHHDVFYIESAMTLLVAHLLRHYSNYPNQPHPTEHLTTSKLNLVIDYIQAHLDRNPSLVELAAIADLSPGYLIKRFKQSTGMTPHQYLLQCRIQKAKQLLCQKQLPLAEVAQLVGFHDQSRFTSTFRKRVGVTPKQYREQDLTKIRKIWL